MLLTAETMEGNFESLKDTISTLLSKDPRKQAILDIHEKYSLRISTAPASGKKNFHNGFLGGYVLHILGVISNVQKIADLWKQTGIPLDFTKEEMVFSALFHDFGKIGDEENDYYIPCEDAWLKKKGQDFIINPKLNYMKFSDRSIYMLASHGIPFSQKEYLAIKTHDGLYEEANKAYLISYNEGFELKTTLPHILHQADFLTSYSEKWTNGSLSAEKEKPNTVEFSSPKEITKKKSSALSKFLDE